MQNNPPYTVIWSIEAEASFLVVIDDLLFRWTEREANIFIDRTQTIIEKISIEPYMFRAYEKDPSIRHGILHRNVTMFYRVIDKTRTIHIMLFWSTKSNPNIKL